MLTELSADIGPFRCARPDCDACAKCIRAGVLSSRPVFLTDSPAEARRLCASSPVIGITGSGADSGAWDGIPWLALDFDAVDPRWISRVYCRYHHLPVAILSAGEFTLREICMADRSGLERLYRDPACQRFLPRPPAAAGQPDEWLTWLLQYQENLRQSEGPSLLSIVHRSGRFAGLISLEYTSAAALTGRPMAVNKGIHPPQTAPRSASASQNAPGTPDASGPCRQRTQQGAWQTSQDTGPDFGAAALWDAEEYYLGYALLPEFRGQHLAVTAAKALMDFAAAEWEIDRFFLVCSAENAPSAAAARHLGFLPAMRDGSFLLYMRTAENRPSR